MLKRMRKIHLILLSALLLVSFGCAQKQEAGLAPEYEYVIGVSQTNLIEPWRIAFYEEMREQSNLHDNMRLVFTDAAGDPGRQVDDVEHLLAMGIDLLIISPSDDAGLREIIDQAYQSIPVIVLDREIEGTNYTLFIGSDNMKIGRLVGEYTANLLGETGGTVLEIIGNENSPPAQALSQGFAEFLSKNPQIKVVDIIDGDWLRDTAERRMKEYLIKSEKVDIVFAHNDAMAHGAFIAAQDFRVDGIQFIGVDGLDNEGKALVERGVLSGTFFRHTGGKEAIEWALRILSEEKDIPQQIILEPLPITQ